MSHSRVSPSSAGQWVHCTGMVEMVKDIPDSVSDSAIEGDTAHWLAAQLIGNQALKDSEVIGVTAPTGHIIDKDMFDYIAPYARDVYNEAGLNFVHVEESVKIPAVHAEAHGTPDSWYFNTVDNILFVWDLKYGWGIVEVYENWQLIMYVIGILARLSLQGDISNITVKMRLVQPRPYHEDGAIREWSIPAAKMVPYVNRLNAAAHEALGGNAKLTSGSHCRYCLARATCPADRHASMNAIDVAGIPTGHDILNYDYELDVLARAKEVIVQRHDALEEHVKELIKNGTPVPGRSITSVPGRGSTWIKPVEEIITLGNIYRIDLKKPLATLTPTQAIKAGIPKEMIDGYSQHKPSGLKLVKDDQRKVKELLS